jgi:hypothetical protein
MAIDVPDTDFQVLLYEILPDGTSILLTSDQKAGTLSRVA